MRIVFSANKDGITYRNKKKKGNEYPFYHTQPNARAIVAVSHVTPIAIAVGIKNDINVHFGLLVSL